VRFRFVVVALVLALPACSQWVRHPPTAASGGVGITVEGDLAEGPGAVSSVSLLPTHAEEGVAPPYGASGEAAAYEFGRGYRLGAGDRLNIRVPGEADLTAEYIVDGAGNISLPYIRTVRVAGLTAPEAENLIAARLRDGYLRNPSVSIQVTTTRPFYILGEVNTAGSYPYQPGMTVQNAIAIAGGYTARGNQGAVLITRRNVQGTDTHKVPVTTQIYPGDVIYVRERWF
jgi:polysaccharide biosynthesis/export protein